MGTAVYAASFLLLDESRRPGWLAPLAMCVAIASAVSWPVLGLALRTLSPDRTALVGWFDACLVAMAFGEAWLLAAALWNAMQALTDAPVSALLGVHLALLVGADCTMWAVFVRRAARLGVSRRRATLLWLGVLNGSFALLLVILAPVLGYA